MNERRPLRIELDRMKLQLHPEKTRRVDLTEGHRGFDFLGCHLRKRVSGKLLEKGVRRFLPAPLALGARDEGDAAEGAGGPGGGTHRAPRAVRPRPKLPL